MCFFWTNMSSFLTWCTVIMSKISDKTEKFSSNYSYLFWGLHFIGTQCIIILVVVAVVVVVIQSLDLSCRSWVFYCYQLWHCVWRQSGCVYRSQVVRWRLQWTWVRLPWSAASVQRQGQHTESSWILVHSAWLECVTWPHSRAVRRTTAVRRWHWQLWRSS